MSLYLEIVLIPLTSSLSSAVQHCRSDDLLKRTWKCLSSMNIHNRDSLLESIFIRPFLQSVAYQSLSQNEMTSLLQWMQLLEAKWKGILSSSYASLLDDWEHHHIQSHLSDLLHSVRVIVLGHF